MTTHPKIFSAANGPAGFGLRKTRGKKSGNSGVGKRNNHGQCHYYYLLFYRTILGFFVMSQRKALLTQL